MTDQTGENRQRLDSAAKRLHTLSASVPVGKHSHPMGLMLGDRPANL
jgi:hypothetical protein